MLAPVVAFAALLQDMGLTQAAVQRSKVTDEHLSALFYVSVGVSLALALAMIATSPVVAAFYQRSELTMLTCAFSTTLVLTGAASQPTAILQRQFRFAALAWADVLAAIAGLATGVAVAVTWRSYWALFAGPVVYALVQLAIVWISARWKPGPPDFGHGFRQLIGFGGKVTTSNILNFVSRNADNVLIGRYAGSLQLGYYDRAYRLLLFPQAQLNAPLSRVMFPTLSRLQGDDLRYRSTYVACVGMILTLAQPGTLFVLTHAHTIVPLVLGRQWSSAADIFAWLGISALYQPFTSTIGWLFLSQARTTEYIKIAIYCTATTILSFVVGLRWGALGVATAYCISDYVLRAPVLIWVAGRSGPVRRRDLCAIGIAHALSLSAAVAASFVMDVVWPYTSLATVFAKIIVTYVAYVGALFLSRNGRALIGRVHSTIGLLRAGASGV